MKIVALFCSLSLLSCASESGTPAEMTTQQIVEPTKDASSETALLSDVEKEVETDSFVSTEDLPSKMESAPTKKEKPSERPSKEQTQGSETAPAVVEVKEERIEMPPAPAPMADNANAYADILSNYVSADGKVNYKSLMMKKDWIDQAITYCKRNAPTSSWSKNKTMAYWINTYNLFTLKLIVDNYPVKSILEISNGKPWDNKFIEIAGKKLSLNDIENNILRKDFSDPRIHFAINCASISCPKLLNKPYTESNLNALLDAQAKRYLLDTKQNYISKDKLEIAEIFNWFKDDFKVVGGVVAFIEKQTGKTISDKASISYKTYNWNLNE